MSVQERVRYHQYMRPRYSNPTFASSNVGTSLGILYAPQNMVVSSGRIGNHEQNKMNYGMSNYNMPASQPMPNQSKVVQSNNKANLQSNLSNYGTKSLGKLQKLPISTQANNQTKITPRVASKLIDQRDIYEKQKKNYNIISIQPLQYAGETIKKYSKYRLQNKDMNYYKNLKLEEQYKHGFSSGQNYLNDKIGYQSSSQVRNPQGYNRQSNPEITNINMTNSMVQNSNVHEKPTQQFRAKMLNNIDELGGVL